MTRYPTRNRYFGDWKKGKRHGQGTFFYANGAIYEGEWVQDKKEGQAKYTFENGFVYDGEFKADEMVAEVDSKAYEQFLFEEWTMDMEGEQQSGQSNSTSYDMQRLRHCTLRHIADLLSIYSFYSSMGCLSFSHDNTYTMNRLQFHRFLKDAKIGELGLSMCEVDRLIHNVSEDWSKHHPMDAILPRHFLVALTRIAYKLFGDDHFDSDHPYSACMQTFLDHHVLTSWGRVDRVGGFLFKYRDVDGVVPLVFGKMPGLTELYHIYSTKFTDDDETLAARECLRLMNDLSLLHETDLTAAIVCRIMREDNPLMMRDGHLDMRVELSHLEMIECFVGCAVVKKEGIENPGQPIRIMTPAVSQSPSGDLSETLDPGGDLDDVVADTGDDAGTSAEPVEPVASVSDGAEQADAAAAVETGGDAADGEGEVESENGVTDEDGSDEVADSPVQAAPAEMPVINVQDDGTNTSPGHKVTEDQVLDIISEFIGKILP